MLFRKLAMLGACIIAVSSCLAISEEEYLNNIDQHVDSEASKMDAAHSLDPGGAPAPVIQMKSRAEGQLNKAEFESFMKERNRGTYSFYQSLSEDDQVAVYREFSAGMSMRKIRRLIIKLKLQHRSE